MQGICQKTLRQCSVMPRKTRSATMVEKTRFPVHAVLRQTRQCVSLSRTVADPCLWVLRQCDNKNDFSMCVKTHNTCRKACPTLISGLSGKAMQGHLAVRLILCVKKNKRTVALSQTSMNRESNCPRQCFPLSPLSQIRQPSHFTWHDLQLYATVSWCKSFLTRKGK